MIPKDLQVIIKQYYYNTVQIHSKFINIYKDDYPEIVQTLYNNICIDPKNYELLQLALNIYSAKYLTEYLDEGYDGPEESNIIKYNGSNYSLINFAWDKINPDKVDYIFIQTGYTARIKTRYKESSLLEDSICVWHNCCWNEDHDSVDYMNNIKVIPSEFSGYLNYGFLFVKPTSIFDVLECNIYREIAVLDYCHPFGVSKIGYIISKGKRLLHIDVDAESG
jgi:hypothetical protein